MPSAKIVDRSSVEILLHNRRRDVRLTRYCGCISEPLRNEPHDGCDRALLLAFRLRKPLLGGTLGEVDRREERPAPGAEVLGAELLPEVDLHVVVQAGVREVVGRALPLVLEHARPPDLEQSPHRRREVRIHDLRANADPVLCRERQADAAAPHLHVATQERRHAVRPVANVPLGADPEPAQLDQPKGDRGDTLAIEFLLVEMGRHRLAERRKGVAEADELVVLGPLLLGSIVRAVEVLLPARGVEARGLELRRRPRRDPDILPRGRDRERLDPSELPLVGDPLAPAVVVAKRALATLSAPPHSPVSTPLPSSAMRDERTIVVLEGDETGQELLEESLRVLEPSVIGVALELPRFDLSLERRRETGNGIVHEAAAAIREHGLGLKAATVTPEGRGDVGSPNRLLREQIGGKVIVRTGRRIPGVAPLGGVHAPISIVRMAVGDAYGATEWREGEGDDEVAFRTERIERRICHAVAECAFRQAARTGAKVFGGPKYTVSPTYEGMLKEEMDAAAGRHPDVPYEPQLIDATFALLLSSAGAPLVIPALNRDGDSP